MNLILVSRACCLLTLLACQSALAAQTYDVHYRAKFEPEQNRVKATIEVRQSQHALRELDFFAPEWRFSDFRGDGGIERSGDRVSWKPPVDGGTLTYDVEIDHKRGQRFDARLEPSWAVLRLDDVFPPARVRSAAGAESRATLSLEGPPGWSFESRYGRVRQDIPVANPDRRFDRPTGWLAAGRMGVRREWIGERRVTVAGPTGQDLRRLDIIAFLRWTLPSLVRVFPEFPSYLLIVGARDGMWRGGLSGPDSLYLHSERPLISENGTSTLLHELVHIATGTQRGRREDWIVEGLAEFYSLEVLRRSDGLGEKRYRQAFDRLEAWSKKDDGELKSPSTGADTARATLFFRDLHDELNRRKAGGLDPVARRLLASRDVDADRLRALVEKALDGPSGVLDRALGEPPRAAR